MSNKIFKCLESKKEIRIGMIGLEAAGKTTIIYKRKLNDFVANVPTIGSTM